KSINEYGKGVDLADLDHGQLIEHSSLVIDKRIEVLLRHPRRFIEIFQNVPVGYLPKVVRDFARHEIVLTFVRVGCLCPVLGKQAKYVNVDIGIDHHVKHVAHTVSKERLSCNSCCLASWLIQLIEAIIARQYQAKCKDYSKYFFHDSIFCVQNVRSRRKPNERVVG